MPLDTSSYYPVTPGHSCEPEGEESPRIPDPPAQRPPEPPAPEPETGWRRAVTVLSTVLSWVLVPLLMPVYGTLLIFNESILYYNPLSTKAAVTGIIAIITLVVPMASVVLLKRLGIIHDIGLNGRRERLIPYIVTILSMAGSGWFMLGKHAPMWAGMFYIGGAVAALVCMAVNFRWKISAHAAGIAGIVALLVRVGGLGFPSGGLMSWLVVWVMLSGLLGAARIWMGRHTVWQVLAGLAVGYVSVILMTLV